MVTTFLKESKLQNSDQTSLSPPCYPTPSIFWIKEALLRMSAFRSFHIPQSGGSEFFQMHSFPGVAAPSPQGCGWCWGVQRLAPTQESLRHLVWEPGTLHRQTRGWGMHPPSRPRGKQRRTKCKRKRSNLSWGAQFPPPPTWTWKCRLTVRMGRVAWIHPWWDIQADLAWGHRRKEPINDKTWVTNQQ